MAEQRIFSGIRLKMIAGIVLLITLIMAGVNLVITDEVRRTILGESLDKGRAVARNIALIAEEAILTMDDTSLFIPLSRTVEESRGVMYAFITDNSGNVIAHNDVNQVDLKHVEPEMVTVVSLGEGYRIISYMQANRLMYEIDSQVGGLEKLGKVHIGITGSVIDKVVEKTGKDILFVTLAGLLAGGLGAFILATFHVKPILMLAKGVRAIGEGDLEQKIEVGRKDEIGDLTTAFNQMAEGLKEREFIRQTFQKFVHKDIADELLKNPDMIKVGGEKKRATIMFTDIRQFTSMSEYMNPEDVIDVVNDYFKILVPIVEKHGGVLDKFIGDSMMIVFGTPISKEDDPLRSVRAGLEIRDAVKKINMEREALGKKAVIMGVGINTGNVVAGNVGTENRMEYTVLGDAVNVAARIEGLSKTGEVLISEETYAEVKEHVIAVKGDDKVPLKGKSEAIHIYRVDKLLQENRVSGKV